MIVKICLRGKPKGLNMTGQNKSKGETKGPKHDRQNMYEGLDPLVSPSYIFWSVLFRPFGFPL
jgi:hypothetical protein